jgi:NhaP-type Na+/H+ or K+/H+ antiporter
VTDPLRQARIMIRAHLTKRRRRRFAMFALTSLAAGLAAAATATNIHADGPAFVTTLGLFFTPWLILATREASRRLSQTEREIGMLDSIDRRMEDLAGTEPSTTPKDE